VWVLFGSEWDYCKGLRNVYATLELKEVMAQKNSFTVEHCCQITWAIIDDGRAHFDDVKTMLDFKGPDEPVFPQSFLIDILRNFRYAIPVEQANFPDEWKRKVCIAAVDMGRGCAHKKLASFRHKTQKFFFFGGITPWNFLPDTPIFFDSLRFFLIPSDFFLFPTGLLTDQPRRFSKIQRTPF
jgi:hypothetical protein